MLGRLTVRDLDVAGKRVFVRVDFNVPLNEDGEVTDERRIRAALPTIGLLRERGAAVVLASHLGRPKGEVVESLRMAPVAVRLSKLLGVNVATTAANVGSEVQAAAKALGAGDVLLLENLRFDRREKECDEEFSRELASLGDVYVNDAFGAAHRAHASISGVPAHLPQAAAGLLLAKELEFLGGALDAPERPFVLVFGGAKISDKVPVLRRLLDRVDVAVIGGAMAYTFLTARGVDVGASRVETDAVGIAGEILAEADRRGVRVLLPTDHVVAATLAEGVETRVDAPGISGGMMGLDVGPVTAGAYASEIAQARTVLWNGPMGVFEIPPFDSGTRVVGQAIADVTGRGATSVVGGGDTAAAAEIAGIAKNMTHVSTGGGASLALLAGERLPGVEALTRTQRTRIQPEKPGETE